MPRDASVLRGKIPYNSKSRNLGGFVEILAPGVFADSLRQGGYDGDVIARYEHDSRGLLGRRSAGTLRLSDGPEALRYDVDLPDTSVGRDVATLAERGDLNGTSFSFIVENYERDEDWSVTPEGVLLRVVKRAQIAEVSPVATPAYPASELTAA